MSIDLGGGRVCKLPGIDKVRIFVYCRDREFGQSVGPVIYRSFNVVESPGSEGVNEV